MKEENGAVRKGESSRNGIWIVVELGVCASNLLLLSVDSGQRGAGGEGLFRCFRTAFMPQA